MRDPYTKDEAERARLGRMIKATSKFVDGDEDLVVLARYWVKRGWARVEAVDDERSAVFLTPAGIEVADASLC